MMLQTFLIWAQHFITIRFMPSSDDRNAAGQGLVEYALILVLVSVVVAALLTVFGPTLGNMFSNIVATVNGSQR